MLFLAASSLPELDFPIGVMGKKAANPLRRQPSIPSELMELAEEAGVAQDSGISLHVLFVCLSGRHIDRLK